MCRKVENQCVKSFLVTKLPYPICINLTPESPQRTTFEGGQVGEEIFKGVARHSGSPF